ncbi:MAG: exonuclease SbcCD subunit D [Limosilactobacillus coleohominis]|uniref:exonuclease SbcCD subunit D n=1 Tax=Limosilactobacillus coleohominis TaxID=181675 RepID=UPI002A7EE43F|nr:exonuclease SbcCD subunit D [Limosilactobacillus coleohominis]MCI5812171.1 exonuclease SbcCD subunit D [Lactobacillus sp.]MDY3702231.1 exonuclease SbcCD subunit D [Limosilactobacillus coleohominis]MDY5628608.1 exonuclease SbcCD subunit D [Limosilactobacillus coleohominis]
MRFLHTGDWHIGKNLAGYNLLADQHATFQEICKIANDKQVDAVVIAGDLYDRTIPSEAAIQELTKELATLNIKEHLPVLAISGNHDSATRLGIGHQWFVNNDFYLNTNFSDAFHPISIQNTQFFLLPFFGLQEVRNYFADDRIQNINTAMQKIVTKMKEAFDPQSQHVLVAHFFAAGSKRTAESETMIEVGGLSAVNADILKDFDYVALGHLHNKNALHEERVRYSGSPMKLSVSEATMEKGVWIVDTDPFEIQWVPLKPVHDIHVLEDSMDTLTDEQFAKNYAKDDYYAIKLTDREIIPDVMNRLRQYYPQILSLSRKYGFSDPKRHQQSTKTQLSPDKLFDDFFQQTIGTEMSAEQEKLMRKTLEEVMKEND